MKLIFDRDDNPTPRWGISLNRKPFGWYLIIDLWRLWLCVGIEKTQYWTQEDLDRADANAGRIMMLIDPDYREEVS